MPKFARKGWRRSSPSSSLAAPQETTTQALTAAAIATATAPTTTTTTATTTITTTTTSQPDVEQHGGGGDDDIEGDSVRWRLALKRENKKLQVMMESVIPKHLVSKMRADLMAPAGYQKSNFEKYYLEYYESVSILFADIVGFTKISSHCTAKELVEMLNELFGRFDKAAVVNKCLRIKILGDCYYCVSGVPDGSTEPHAKQCVEMGLDMIDILDELAPHLRAPSFEGPSLDSSSGGGGNSLLAVIKGGGAAADDEKRLKMRIGIHTGQVLCGIMGKKKWQFDVYSNDVMLANHMEHSGVPGRVHITQATLDHLERDKENHYRVEPANGRERDDYIAELDIKTYFVTTPIERRKDSSTPTAARLAAPPTNTKPPALAATTTTTTITKTTKTTPADLVVSLKGARGPAVQTSATPRELPPPSNGAQQVSLASFASVVDHTGKTSLLGSKGASPGNANGAVELSSLQRRGANQAPAGTGTATTTTVAPPEPSSMAAAGARSSAQGAARLGGALPAADTIVTINQISETVSLLAHEGGLAAGGGRGAAGDKLAGVAINNAVSGVFINNNNNMNATHADPVTQAARPVTKSKSQQSIQLETLPSSFTRPDLAHSTSTLQAGGKHGRFKRTTRALMHASHFIRTIDPPFANLDSDTNSDDNVDETICDKKAKPAPQIEEVNKWTLRFKDGELGRLYREEARQQVRAHHHHYLNGCNKFVSLLATFKQHSLLTLMVLLIGAVLLVATSYATTLRRGDASGDDAPSTGAKVDHFTQGWIAAYLVVALALISTMALLLRLIHHVHQAELNSRRDFALRQRAIRDKRSLLQMSECNRFMLYNILPKHVAEYYLESFMFLSKRRAQKELYSRSYEMVGVAFATVTNFNDDFYEEDDVNDHGKGCLNLLNEILCDFDEQLNREQFKMIDKIKTIGTTYMSAIGLCPSSEDGDANAATGAAASCATNGANGYAPQPAAAGSREPPSRELAHQLRTMLEFVMAMRECLKEISNNSFHEYKMRAGVNVGPVIAGVIGATKPQYDIWGNTVNVASRMESTCEPNEIQVTQEVYMILKNFYDDIKFVSRGLIAVKGKGDMETYYVYMPQKRP